MSDQPDPFAAVLAEMRGIAGNMETAAKKFDMEHRQDKRCLKHPHCFRAEDLLRDANGLRDWADRIEAAYKRERAEWHAETDAAKDDRNRIACRMRREFAEKCRNCTERAPGNAAAMRAALEGVTHALCYLCVCGGECESGEGERCAKVKAARAALSAPARNCDRFDEYHDAVDAWHREERCLGRHQDGGTCEKDPLASTLAPVCFARWLFAPAKGVKE